MGMLKTGIPEKAGSITLVVTDSNEKDKTFELRLNLIDVEEIQQSNIIFFNNLGNNDTAVIDKLLTNIEVQKKSE